MCGRFALELMSWDEYSAAMGSLTLDPAQVRLPFSNYNISPSSLKPETFIPAIRKSTNGAECVMLRWGLVPFFARGVVDPKYSTINAKSETAQTLPMFRGPWKRSQRCIIPASGFFEWQLQSDMKTKVPFYISVADQPHFGFAGLWERSEAADGFVIESCTILMMRANRLLASIHNSKQVKGKPTFRTEDEHRMPVILHAKDLERWLTCTPEKATELFQSYPDELMTAWPISTSVNSIKNKSVDIIQPADIPRSTTIS